ncbi:Asp23/Gls24 family envelope stress response protein [Clostridiales bacterium FE2011]|nr:Asp23/Gls24 family envelope stress response protein [Clostridiales bacterium FE2011]
MEDLTPSSNITYNNEVVAIIAGLAANEVEGIAGMCTVSGSIMSKNRNVTKGVKVEVGTEEVAVDLYVIVEYGIPIQRAAADAQENVRKAIESMTGLHVVRVDVHVQSVSFEQDKKALQAGAQQAVLAAGEVEEPVRLPEKEKEEKPAPAPEPVPEAHAAAEPVKKPAPKASKPKAKAEKKPEAETAEKADGDEPAAKD